MQRPVEWILWNPYDETALIIIPEEAEILIPMLRTLCNPKTHLILYAAPITKGMTDFNTMSYYALPTLPKNHTVPDWLSIELGIFSGRLYMSLSEYQLLGEYLDQADGTKYGTQVSTKLFCRDPIGFLLEWVDLRRKGQDVLHTPVGYLCQRRSLPENHHFFSSDQGSSANPTVPLEEEKDDVSEDEEELNDSVMD